MIRDDVPINKLRERGPPSAVRAPGEFCFYTWYVSYKVIHKHHSDDLICQDTLSIFMGPISLW